MSIQQKANYSEELIELHIKTSKAGSDKFYILPVFKMNNETKRNKLDMFTNIDVIVDELTYNEYDLDTRPIYVSTDSADKRPFIYYGAIEPFAGANKKTFLIDLIVKPQSGCKVIVKDGDNYNLKMYNINIEIIKNSLNKNSTNHHIQRPLPMTNDKKNNHEPKPFLPPLDIQENRTIQQLINNEEIITSNDAVRDKTWKWRGVSKIKGKNRWSATCKLKYIGTFGHPLDAARAYNDFVIDNGLPYEVNNIPGFLKMKFIDESKELYLEQIETHKLAELIVKRTTPGGTDQ